MWDPWHVMVHSSPQVCKTGRNQRSRRRQPFLAPLCIHLALWQHLHFSREYPSMSAMYTCNQTCKTNRGVGEGKKLFLLKGIPLLYPMCTVVSQEYFASLESFLHCSFQEERSVVCIIRPRISEEPIFFSGKSMNRLAGSPITDKLLPNYS